MTPSIIARFVFPAALAAAGCTTSTDTCLCPVGAAAEFPVPNAAANPIVSVSADPPCTAATSGDGSVTLSRPDSGICRGRAVLTDGDTYAFSVEFRPIDTGCCGTLPYPIDASPPTLIEGGQD